MTMDDEARDADNTQDCGCSLLMSNSFLAIWLAMALVRCQAAIRSGRNKMRPSFCSRLYAMACTSHATVAQNVIVYLVGIELVRESDACCYSAVQQRALVILLLDHIQHLRQSVWAVARSLSGQGHQMTPRQERKSLRTCTHPTSDLYWEKLVVYFQAMGVTLTHL